MLIDEFKLIDPFTLRLFWRPVSDNYDFWDKVTEMTKVIVIKQCYCVKQEHKKKPYDCKKNIGDVFSPQFLCTVFLKTATTVVHKPGVMFFIPPILVSLILLYTHKIELSDNSNLYINLYINQNRRPGRGKNFWPFLSSSSHPSHFQPFPARNGNRLNSTKTDWTDINLQKQT